MAPWKPSAIGPRPGPAAVSVTTPTSARRAFLRVTPRGPCARPGRPTSPASGYGRPTSASVPRTGRTYRGSGSSASHLGRTSDRASGSLPKAGEADDGGGKDPRGGRGRRLAGDGRWARPVGPARAAAAAASPCRKACGGGALCRQGGCVQRARREVGDEAKGTFRPCSSASATATGGTAARPDAEQRRVGARPAPSRARAPSPEPAGPSATLQRPGMVRAVVEVEERVVVGRQHAQASQGRHGSLRARYSSRPGKRRLPGDSPRRSSPRRSSSTCCCAGGGSSAAHFHGRGLRGSR